MIRDLVLGAIYQGDNRCRFCVWAPYAEKVEVDIIDSGKRVSLVRDKQGYHYGIANGVAPGNLYYYLLDGDKKRPDPASRYQPEGVHGPSQVVDAGAFVWSDQCWFGLTRENLIVYELHIGTFSPEGTFDAVIPYLEELKELGITAIEIMPVAQFPGKRNWGYDGVGLYAVQNSYGGPEGLRRLVDACHKQGLAVILDVVYNHLGPEGNYLGDFGPYFTDRYHTPWGKAINFDGPHSDDVRRFFIENTIYWLKEFHVDGFRLDAIHAILDLSAYPFLEELGKAVHRQAEQLGRRVHVIAESDLNDARVIRPRVLGGYGLDAQWSDDFHHSLNSLLTGEQQGYYRDFGKLSHLVKALRTGYVYTGQYSEFRRRRHGNIPEPYFPDQFLVFAQNHDQVGNRAGGERLSTLVSFSGLKLAASVVLLSPFIPLLFMGEEYGETAPFQYFTSHSDPELVKAVRKGRREEFAGFAWEGEVPDPQDEDTFLRSCLNRGLRHQGKHRVLWELYRELIKLRRKLPVISCTGKENIDVMAWERERVLFVRYCNDEDEVCAIFCFNDKRLAISLPIPRGHWHKVLDTAEECWLGDGTTVPVKVESDGNVELTLTPMACNLIWRVREE